MDTDRNLRRHLINLLNFEGAHLDFDSIIKDFPEKYYGKKVSGIPYTAWQLLEHIRISQWDILEFSRDPRHVSPEWPEGYWPEENAPADAAQWQKSVEDFHRDLDEMKKLVENPETDLFGRIPHGTGQTILREALLVADHNSYHLGQMVQLRRILGVWNK